VGKKDETFANWLEKALKVKSASYVQAGEEPASTEAVFELALSAQGKPTETLQVLKSEDDWYARSDFSRGLVKLNRSLVEDPADEVDDIIAGREPPPSEKPAPTQLEEGAEGGPPPGLPGMPPGMPPGVRPGGLPPGIPGGKVKPH
jgi:hypothetical protein